MVSADGEDGSVHYLSLLCVCENAPYLDTGRQHKLYKSHKTFDLNLKKDLQKEYQNETDRPFLFRHWLELVFQLEA